MTSGYRWGYDMLWFHNISWGDSLARKMVKVHNCGSFASKKVFGTTFWTCEAPQRHYWRRNSSKVHFLGGFCCTSSCILRFLLLIDQFLGNLLGASDSWTQISTEPSSFHGPYSIPHIWMLLGTNPNLTCWKKHAIFDMLISSHQKVSQCWDSIPTRMQFHRYIALLGFGRNCITYINLKYSQVTGHNWYPEIADQTSISITTMVRYPVISIFHRCFTHFLRLPSCHRSSLRGPRAPTSSELEPWSFLEVALPTKTFLVGRTRQKSISWSI